MPARTSISADNAKYDQMAFYQFRSGLYTDPADSYKSNCGDYSHDGFMIVAEEVNRPVELQNKTDWQPV